MKPPPLPVPERTSKPRSVGLTEIVDEGLGAESLRGVLEIAADYVDAVAVAPGAALLDRGLAARIALYRTYDVSVVVSGTVFEAFVRRERVAEYKRWLSEAGLHSVQVSDGVLSLPRERKLELIADLARDFTVLSKVGSKNPELVSPPYRWVTSIRDELEAGAWKVVLEGDRGATGIFRPAGDLRTGLLEEVVHGIDPSSVVFEAPTRPSRAWLVRRLGPDVNVAGVAPDAVLSLEALRAGFEPETMLDADERP